MLNASSDPPVLRQPQTEGPKTGTVPWNGWLGMLYIVVVFFGTQFVASLLLAIIVRVAYGSGIGVGVEAGVVGGGVLRLSGAVEV